MYPISSDWKIQQVSMARKETRDYLRFIWIERRRNPRHLLFHLFPGPFCAPDFLRQFRPRWERLSRFHVLERRYEKTQRIRFLSIKTAMTKGCEAPSRVLGRIHDAWDLMQAGQRGERRSRLSGTKSRRRNRRRGGEKVISLYLKTTQRTLFHSFPLSAEPILSPRKSFAKFSTYASRKL